jgi:hypothetical protein
LLPQQDGILHKPVFGKNSRRDFSNNTTKNHFFGTTCGTTSWMNPAILSMKDFSATDSGLSVSPIGLLKRRGDSLEDISDYKEETH